MYYSTAIEYLEDGGFKAVGAKIITFTLCATLVSACLFILKRAWRRKYNFSRRTSFLNVWGNTVDYVGSTKIAGISRNVYLLQLLMGYKQLFKSQSFYHFWFGFSPFIVVTKARGIEEIIALSKNMEKSWLYNWIHPWLGTGLLTSFGPKWKSRRKLLTPAFHFDILKDFIPVFNEQSLLLVQILAEESKKPWIDIVKPITLCSLDILCETTLGVPIGAQRNSESEYVKAVSGAARAVMKRFINPLYVFDWIFNLSHDGHQFRKCVKLLHSFTRKVISDKKEKLLNKTADNSKKKRKALMDLLLEQHIENQALSEEDIREEVDTFVFEGHDTTSMGMSWALYLIGLYKDVQENIHEELDRIFGDDKERHVTTDDLKDMGYLDRVLKESQRLYPSVPFIARKLSEDVTIEGTKIPKDVGVAILIYLLHRDETVFPNPEKFDTDRFLPENTADRNPFAYIPFSAGPRNCIGQRFALMEEKVVIANVLRNFTLESLDPRDKVLTNPEVTLRPAGDIRIKLRPRRTL